jgi:hypothetical protein
MLIVETIGRIRRDHEVINAAGARRVRPSTAVWQAYARGPTVTTTRGKDQSGERLWARVSALF